MFEMSMSMNQEVKENLSKLATRVRKKALTKALREGAKIVQGRARVGARKNSGILKASIKVRSAKMSRKKHIVGMMVITAASDPKFSGKTFYAGFREFGWKPKGKHSQKKSGTHFLENAFKSEANQVLNSVESSMSTAISQLGK